MLWEWLTASIDPGRDHVITAAQSWHGRFMTLAWGVCVPAGILIARYLKVTRRQDWPRELDNRFWWRSHLILQNTAAVAMVLGVLILLVMQGLPTGTSWHPMLGWIVVALAGLQILSGYLRGTKGGPGDPQPEGSLHGDHYDMSPRRRAFEHVHKALGYGLLVGAVLVLLNGLWIVNAPRWMPLSLLAYWTALVAVVAVVRRPGPRIATYQAIWGTDDRHPGNR